MFYSRQVYTTLVESIWNYVFQEEMKIDLDYNKTEVTVEGSSTKQFFFPWCQKLWKIPTNKFIF